MRILDDLLDPVRRFVETEAWNLVQVTEGKLKDRDALYLYLCPRDGSIFHESQPYTAVRISDATWDILYVGQSKELRKRHGKHLEQLATCKEHQLKSLLEEAIQGNPEASVSRLNLSHPLFVEQVQERSARIPGYPHCRADCKRSIGWSLTTHLAWIPCADHRLRRRVEDALIAVLAPPLNWQRMT